MSYAAPSGWQRKHRVSPRCFKACNTIPNINRFTREQISWLEQREACIELTGGGVPLAAQLIFPQRSELHKEFAMDDGYV